MSDESFYYCAARIVPHIIAKQQIKIFDIHGHNYIITI